MEAIIAAALFPIGLVTLVFFFLCKAFFPKSGLSSQFFFFFFESLSSQFIPLVGMIIIFRPWFTNGISFPLNVCTPFFFFLMRTCVPFEL